jgi:orotidine-5'-phosphate decarboxylase
MGARRGIVALDRPNWSEAERLVVALGSAVDFYKVGLELFVADGPGVVRELKGRGKRVFLDLKLHDIPTTVFGAARAAARLEADLLTVHAAGGADMVRAACEGVATAGGGRTCVLGVTVLTSLSAANLPRAFRRDVPLAQVVTDLAGEAVEAGAGGVVCAGAEIAAVRGRVGDVPWLVVPGTRPAGAEAQDQARVVTPGDALEAGASWLVVGRSVTASADPRAAWEAFWAGAEARA